MVTFGEQHPMRAVHKACKATHRQQRIYTQILLSSLGLRFLERNLTNGQNENKMNELDEMKRMD